MLIDEPARAMAQYASISSTLALCALYRMGILTDEEMEQARLSMKACLNGVQRDKKLSDALGLYAKILDSAARIA
ncbi:hypothetical protein [Novosphingobium sp.]|uniref:hypothetical protein n=1 Tax=Novosphingobium sp. TaxID=1874826 RepID=UPI00286D293C|nr:hypothetical protein [Novosphingobium sp.]